ncbi:WD40 repeat-like protein [Gymnopus androsaceus JB14]|uniref:WD40 repeat-like protein n=1 Tax=Gymnopus androsaceus JB14 TaxID=1447944 RepID=A0A6A4IW59_9AGAR|nr:WD40 repeat-like protein [Gymnopus androsaceus JB14]
MATLLPPPKRQKVYHGIPEPEPELPKPVRNILVQFVSEDDGSALAPAVNLPADVSREGLEVLVNKLTKSDEPVPFSFHVDCPEDVDAAPGPTRIVISKSIQSDVLNHPTHANSFTEEDVFVVRCSPQSVFRVRPATRCSASLSGHSSPILCASFSPTGALLATGSGDATARLWDLNTETPSHTLVGHKGWVLSVEWEAMERLLATGGHDGHVRDLSASVVYIHLILSSVLGASLGPKVGKPVGDALKGHTKWIMSLSWEPIHLNPKSPRLASSSKDGTVRVWSTLTRRAEYTLGGHTASVNVVKWGGGGTGGFGLKKGVLYTASSDRTVRVWDAENGRQLHILKDHAHWVTTLTLNTDFVLRTGPFDHTGKRPANDEEAQQLALKRYTAILATTPELLITGSDDHTLFLWSLFPSSVPTADAAPSQGKLKPITRLTGHQRQISHVAFSPDGRWAASSSWDSSVRLWEGRTGKFVATLRGHVGAVYRLAWSADGRMLVSASKDATVKIWDLKTYKLKNDLPGHTDEVYCVDFVADKVVSGGRDKHLKIWKN